MLTQTAVQFQLSRDSQKYPFSDAEFRGFVPLGRFDIPEEKSYFSRRCGIEIPRQRIRKKCFPTSGYLTQGKEVKDEE